MIGDWHPNVLEWDVKHDRHPIDFELMLWEAPFWWCLQWWCFTRLATCSFGTRNEHGEEFGMTIAQCCSLWNMVKLYLVLTATSVFSRTRSFYSFLIIASHLTDRIWTWRLTSPPPSMLDISAQTCLTHLVSKCFKHGLHLGTVAGWVVRGLGSC